MIDSPVQQIKDRLDIVEVVGSYLKLQKTGINYRAICPFHSEKKPSFFVSPTRQMFKCFGCNASGSVFDFIMKIEGVEFGDALSILARKAGVELKPLRPELKTQRQRLYEISELACRFFEKQLEASSAGQAVKDYLLKRGLSEESIKKWRLGYAPEQWRTLSDFLVGKGYKREEIIKAGLAVESEKSQTPYDRFRGRMIFPVFDLNSQVVGFGGRIVESQKEKEIAKYINIPNTLIYDKSRMLYGLNFAKMEVRKKDACILTEGYTDVIFAHQAGFQNTVASSGTALTFQQLKILKRYTANLLTAFDMDMAGDLATKRGIDLAQKEDFEVRVISMPPDSDPADIIAKDPEAWKNLVDGAQEITTFYFENAFSAFDKESVKGKKEISKILLPLLRRIPNKILQFHWIQKLANALKVSEEVIVEELKRVAGKGRGFRAREEIQETEEIERKEKSRKDMLEEEIVSLILKNPGNLKILEESFLSLFSSPVKKILATFKKEEIATSEELGKVIQKLEKGEKRIKEILDGAALRAEIEEERESEKEIQLCLNQLKELRAKDKLSDLSGEIRSAEEKGDGKKVKDLMQKFNQIAKSLTENQKNAKNET